MTEPAARLRTLARLAQALADDWPVYEATEADLAIPATAAAGGGTGRSSSIPDPTLAVVASHERYYENVGAITEANGLMRMLQRSMTDVIRQNRHTAETVAAAIRNARCSGEIDPTCTDNAVRDGLCWRCYNRRRRHGTAAARGTT